MAKKTDFEVDIIRIWREWRGSAQSILELKDMMKQEDNLQLAFSLQKKHDQLISCIQDIEAILKKHKLK